MRRLRENSVLNTEIGKTGEVIVEGHVIGRLDGFTFAPDAAEAGSDAKALQATAQKALAGEIDARAEKLAAAPDEQFVLTSDGTIRWTGDAVARLVAADDALHPRLRIISDERLTGAPREAVQTRLDLWLKTHIEKLLGPLFDLHKAEDITGIARGIAFQLIEALGVLERQKIAAEMKDLDQPSRATLRKYGVRFGAYHIYVPALLKPAARALASLLWAEKQSNVDMSALSGAQHLAGSRPHLVPGRQVARPRRLSRARLPAMRRARGAGRYPGASRRSDSPGAGLARSLARRKAGRRVRRPRLCRDAGDDLADRIGRRGFRLDPARARLSHGEASRRCRRSRWRSKRLLRRPRAAAVPKRLRGSAVGRRHCGRAADGDGRRRGMPATDSVAPNLRAAGCPTPPSAPNRAGRRTGCSAEPPTLLPESRSAPAPSKPMLKLQPRPRRRSPAGAGGCDGSCRARKRRKSRPRPKPRPETVAAADAAGGCERCRGRPRPKSPQRRKWSRSGGPVAARKSAGRVTIATARAIRTARRRARTPRSRCRRQVKPARPPRASGIAADGATATPISASPAPMRRRLKRRRAVAGRWRAGQRTARGPQRPSAARAF